MSGLPCAAPAKRASLSNIVWDGSSLETGLSKRAVTADPALARRKSHQIEASQLQKTKLCLFHQQGRCIYGDECSYSHSLIEMRKAPEELRRTKMCEMFLAGRCFDLDCNWAHSEDQIRSRKDARRKARSASKPDINSDLGASAQLLLNRRQSVQQDPSTVELMRQLATIVLAAEPAQRQVLQDSIVQQLQQQNMALQEQLRRIQSNPHSICTPTNSIDKSGMSPTVHFPTDNWANETPDEDFKFGDLILGLMEEEVPFSQAPPPFGEDWGSSLLDLLATQPSSRTKQRNSTASTSASYKMF